MIRSLSDINFETIAQAFGKAFSDYEVHIDTQELRTMLLRRGFVPELSFAAFDNDEITAFTFNGIGFYHGIKTAYDTGSGTVKEYRGQGLASRIFEHSIPYLRKAGIRQYLLEVLQNNTKAKNIYEKLGFKISREFNYFVHQINNLSFSNKVPSDLQIRQNTKLDEPLMQSFWDFEPSWQNSFESILRAREDFIVLEALQNETLVGYLVLEPKSGDITQLAVNKMQRRKGIASALMTEALRLNHNSNIKVINTDITCITTTRFLEANSITISGKQYEMILKL